MEPGNSHAGNNFLRNPVNPETLKSYENGWCNVNSTFATLDYPLELRFYMHAMHAFAVGGSRRSRERAKRPSENSHEYNHVRVGDRIAVPVRR